MKTSNLILTHVELKNFAKSTHGRTTYELMSMNQIQKLDLSLEQ